MDDSLRAVSGDVRIMTTSIEIRDLAEHFEDLLARARAGGEVVVTEDGTPRALLFPLPSASSSPRIAGLHAGSMQAAPDFDAPLPDEFWTG
jgi:prevent-host-death family protein